ncbi:hypothetical protein BDFG_04326, partial [Blastomyces dermatitidis ATCC 26199]
IELLRATVPKTKLSPGSSLNDHTGSYATVLAGGGGGVATAAGGAGDGTDTDGPDADAPTGRTAAAAREAGGGVAMGAELPRLIDAASASNLAFLAATEAAAAPQRHLLTRKHQNKPSTVLQE